MLVITFAYFIELGTIRFLRYRIGYRSKNL